MKNNTLKQEDYEKILKYIEDNSFVLSDEKVCHFLTTILSVKTKIDEGTLIHNKNNIINYLKGKGYSLETFSAGHGWRVAKQIK